MSGPGGHMTVFVVRHLTRYRYKRPVRLGEHRLMFRPRDSFDQRLLHSDLTISPKPTRVRWIHDVFGNCVTLFDFDTSSAHIDVASTIRLEHTPENAPDFQIEEYAKLHPFKYSAEQLPDLRLSLSPTLHQDCEGGREGLVIKNTFLSNTDNASVSLRKLLPESCSLHTVLDCPGRMRAVLA